jgi:hypothetical protein
MKVLHDNILVELDPEVRKIESLFLPDEDSIKYCRRCEAMMEKLGDTSCIGEEVYEHDSYHDRPVFRGFHFDHDIVSVTAPVIQNISRIATVVSVGNKVTDVHPGDRIMIGHTAGGSFDDVRFVQECEVLVIVEEE